MLGNSFIFRSASYFPFVLLTRLAERARQSMQEVVIQKAITLDSSCPPYGKSRPRRTSGPSSVGRNKQIDKTWRPDILARGSTTVSHGEPTRPSRKCAGGSWPPMGGVLRKPWIKWCDAGVEQRTVIVLQSSNCIPIHHLALTLVPSEFLSYD